MMMLAILAVKICGAILPIPYDSLWSTQHSQLSRPQSTTLTRPHSTACTVYKYLEYWSSALVLWFMRISTRFRTVDSRTQPISAKVIRAVRVSTFRHCDYTTLPKTVMLISLQKHVHCQVTAGQISHRSHREMPLVSLYW